MLSGVGITAGYRKGHPVLRDVTIEVAPGEVVGLAGPSGGGKSTLVRVLALLLRPWAGAVTLDGEQVHRFRYAAPRAQRTAVGVVFQSPRRSVDPRLRLREIVAEPLRADRVFGSRRAPAAVAERVAEVAEQVGLTDDLLGRLPHEVSDGQLQRACLARALVLRPRYLICDEMTAMLDASSTAALVQIVRSVGASGTDGPGVLAVSHDEELLDVWADRVVRLGNAPAPSPQPEPVGAR